MFVFRNIALGNRKISMENHRIQTKENKMWYSIANNFQKHKVREKGRECNQIDSSTIKIHIVKSQENVT